MRQVAHITERVCAHGKDARVGSGIENKFLPGFLHAFAAKVNGVASTLIIGFDQKRLRFALASVVVLAPNETARPITILSKRQVINRRRRRAMPVQLRFESFGTLDVT